MIVTEPQTIEAYYQALLDRESSFVGIFFVGVKTTGVFCIATCRARKPKRENVTFYTTLQDVQAEGYRPCKICKPAEYVDSLPPQVAAAFELLREKRDKRVTDAQLRQHQISPEILRRWFKQHYGMTFQAYQRTLRLNEAVQELKQGKRATDAAFESGYESLSGFGMAYKKLLGKSPMQSMNTPIVVNHRFETPLGAMQVWASEQGVCLLEFADQQPRLDKGKRAVERWLNATVIVGENEHTQQAQREMLEYFDGWRQKFEVALHLLGTPFQLTAWAALDMVAFGEQATYQQQALRIDQPKATRAVAAANGQNRVAIIVPCHRVIGSNGSLTGYGGGLERKRWLLEHEQSIAMD